VIVPASSSSLGLRDLGSGPAARRVAHIIIERSPVGLVLLHAALPHALVLDDQIDQTPSQGRITTKITHAALAQPPMS
jgi:hypothetical protein